MQRTHLSRLLEFQRCAPDGVADVADGAALAALRADVRVVDRGDDGGAAVVAADGFDGRRETHGLFEGKSGCLGSGQR